MDFANITRIKKMFEDFDWFENLDFKNNKYIVYVNKMNKEVLSLVPDKIDGKNTLLHFYSSKMCSPNMYYKYYDVDEFYEEQKLIEFVSNNIKTYGKTVFAGMFYEIHDGENSITNLKIKYPHLSIEMERYYTDYGFEKISEELKNYGII